MRNINKTAVIGIAAAMALTLSVAKADVVKPEDVKFDENIVSASLTGVAGNATKGKKWFSNRKLGNCLACHANSAMSGEPFHGEVGPTLDDVAARYSAPELRGILVNSKLALHEDTIMPGFYRVDFGSRIKKKFKGKTILSAQQVEDILAYLQTLKK